MVLTLVQWRYFIYLIYAEKMRSLKIGETTPCHLFCELSFFFLTAYTGNIYLVIYETRCYAVINYSILVFGDTCLIFLSLLACICIISVNFLFLLE